MLHEMNRLAGAMRRWSAKRRSYRTLHALDDRMLKDIGLHRSQIDRIAKRTDPDA